MLEKCIAFGKLCVTELLCFWSGETRGGSAALHKREEKAWQCFQLHRIWAAVAWIEQWLPKHSGNFSQAILLKGLFFSAQHLSGPVLLSPHQSPEDSRTEWQEMSQQEPNPERQHHHPQHPDLGWLCSQWGCSPSHGDINIPHSFSASQMSCKAASEGRGRTPRSSCPSLSPAAKRRAEPPLKLQQQRLTQGCWEALGWVQPRLHARVVWPSWPDGVWRNKDCSVVLKGEIIFLPDHPKLPALATPSDHGLHLKHAFWLFLARERIWITTWYSLLIKPHFSG